MTGYGNSGGIGRREEQGGWTRAGGGGGGAGAKGNTSGDYTEDTGQAARIAYGGDGGAVVVVDVPQPPLSLFPTPFSRCRRFLLLLPCCDFYC